MKTPPLPRPPGKGWLVLIGGGEFSFGETREIDEFLLSMMPAREPRIAFVPAASGSTDYAVHLGKYFRDLAPSVDLVNVPIYRERDGRRGKNLELLRSAGLIYLGGGVPALFLNAILSSPAEEVLRQRLAEGAVIAAIGAAASAMGRVVRDPDRAGGSLQGLNWVIDSAIETGFEAAQDLDLRKLMIAPEIRLGIGIPRSTALAIGPDGVGEILGAAQVAIVRKSAAPSVQ